MLPNRSRKEQSGKVGSRGELKPYNLLDLGIRPLEQSQSVFIATFSSSGGSLYNSGPVPIIPYK